MSVTFNHRFNDVSAAASDEDLYRLSLRHAQPLLSPIHMKLLKFALSLRYYSPSIAMYAQVCLPSLLPCMHRYVSLTPAMYAQVCLPHPCHVCTGMSPSPLPCMHRYVSLTPAMYAQVCLPHPSCNPYTHLCLFGTWECQ